MAPAVGPFATSGCLNPAIAKPLTLSQPTTVGCSIPALGDFRQPFSSGRSGRHQCSRCNAGEVDSSKLRGYQLKSQDGFREVALSRAMSCPAPRRSHRIREKCMAALDGDPIREWIISEGGATKITRITPVAGGCINIANRYDTDAGPFFVKTNRDVGPQMFAAEAKGLEAMVATGTIRVPKPFKVGAMPRRGSFIIMEYVELGTLKGGQAALGRQLAAMHRVGSSDKGFGFDLDNTIGSTPQPNPWTSDWVAFYRDHRLGFQLDLARQQYRDNDLYEKGQQLLTKLPELMGEGGFRPSLLHGDLWSGNITADKEGNPVILDPATYYGHSEAEFGMSWCANFGPSFYNAYFEVMPKEPGFEQRLPLYKLYHYLNHYNLFGSGYRSSCTAIIDSYL